MITHKPELMKSADDILVIDHGKIVGRGKHSELIKNNTYYQKLHKQKATFIIEYDYQKIK